MEEENKPPRKKKHYRKVMFQITKGMYPFEIIPIIDPVCLYTTWDIIRWGFIPLLNWVPIQKAREKILTIITDRICWARYPKEETTKYWIKSLDMRIPWGINPKYKVLGAEIIKFLNFHKVFPK